MLGIRDDRGGHTDTHQNNLALWWLIISPACLQMLWPCSVKCIFHSPSDLPLICVALFFLLLRCHLGWIITWSMSCKQNPHWLPFSSTIYRPSTKTIWSWRKEISTSTHSLPGRPTPMHISPTSTPMMTISPWHSRGMFIWTFLCALYWDSWHHAWDGPTLKLWQLVCDKQTHGVANRGNTHFLSGALGYTWKAQHFADIFCLQPHWETGFPNVDKNKKGQKKRTKKNCGIVGIVIPSNFPVTPLKQTCICNDGK